MENYRADDEVVVLDFETTGMSAEDSRIIEVGAAIVKKGRIQQTFCSFCDPGVSIPYFITSLTGITNAMLRGAPPPEEVMEEFQPFIDGRPILAHNASFDRRFLKAEMKRIGRKVENPFLCTMLLARRLMQHVDNHKLSTLRHHIDFEADASHQEHRALDDVKVTVALWNHMRKQVERVTGENSLNFSLFQKLTRVPKHKVQENLAKLKPAKV